MIEVEGLTRYYGEFAAVQDVSFEIGRNTIVGFLGLNGAGKSTVLKVLGGLLMPSAGKVEIEGIDVVEAAASSRKKIGYLPEDPPLYKEMEVSRFLLWCGEIKGLSRAESEARLPEVLKICQLEEMKNRVIGTLSHGYRKRVGIAQAIIHKPELVILDEPISGLDPVQIVEMRQVLQALKKNSTVLISSHILSEISQTCDRILVLHGGKIVAEGSEAELAAQLVQTLRIEIVVRGSEADAKAAVETVPEVTEVDVKALPNELIHIEAVFGGADKREELVQALVAAGLGVRSMSEDQSGELEDVFLGLTHASEDTRFGAKATPAEPKTTESADEPDGEEDQ